MNETKLSWDDLRLFLKVAEAAGLAGAAAGTGVSPPTLGRRMERLELSLGVNLFHRHARGYDLTDDGADLLARVRMIEEKVVDLERSASSHPRREIVRITAGTWMSSYLAENVHDIWTKDDPFQLFLSSEERRADIARREAVIGFRNKRPDESNLVARKLGRIAFAAYAAVASADGWIQVGTETPSAQWTVSRHDEEIVIAAGSPTTALQLCLAGHGKLVLPCFIGDCTNGLVRLGHPIDELWQEHWIVMHQSDRHRPNVRAAITRLVSLINRDANRFEGKRTVADSNIMTFDS